MGREESENVRKLFKELSWKGEQGHKAAAEGVMVQGQGQVSKTDTDRLTWERGDLREEKGWQGVLNLCTWIKHGHPHQKRRQKATCHGHGRSLWKPSFGLPFFCGGGDVDISWGRKRSEAPAGWQVTGLGLLPGSSNSPLEVSDNKLMVWFSPATSSCWVKVESYLIYLSLNSPKHVWP